MDKWVQDMYVCVCQFKTNYILHKIYAIVPGHYTTKSVPFTNKLDIILNII